LSFTGIFYYLTSYSLVGPFTHIIIEKLLLSNYYFVEKIPLVYWKLRILLLRDHTPYYWKLWILALKNYTPGYWKLRILLLWNYSPVYWELQILVLRNCSSVYWELHILLLRLKLSAPGLYAIPFIVDYFRVWALNKLILKIIRTNFAA